MEIGVDLRMIDFDQDGDMDFVASGSDNTNNHTLWLDSQSGLGEDFQLREICSCIASDYQLVDMDADGDLDFLMSGGDEDNLKWYESVDGGRAFREQMIVDGQAFREIAAGDVDGDGDVDVVAFVYWDDLLNLYINNGDSWGSGGQGSSGIGMAINDQGELLLLATEVENAWDPTARSLLAACLNAFYADL
jgi:hypothetical protein